MQRREFLLGATAALAAQSLHAASPQQLHVATNTYPWTRFAKRESKTCTLHGDKLLAAIASTGIRGYEPIIQQPGEFKGLGAKLQTHGLQMRSLYVNSTLHDESLAKQSVNDVLAIARGAVELGTKIIVTNPSPVRWGGPENKTDAQLMTQAKYLNLLGAELQRLGLTLAYHNHDSELRLGAREFHHMLTATDPNVVKFCLDAHWVFRGCGDSQIALFDVVEQYGNRIVELHLRQSREGIWSEVFAAQGDIDYQRLADWLKSRAIKPHLVLEQAVEADSPNTLDAVEAHRRSFKQVLHTFTV